MKPYKKQTKKQDVKKAINSSENPVADNESIDENKSIDENESIDENKSIDENGSIGENESIDENEEEGSMKQKMDADGKIEETLIVQKEEIEEKEGLEENCMIQTDFFIQYHDMQAEQHEVEEKIKKKWKADNEGRSLETLDLYIKPEENMVYYVVNKTENGSITLFE